METASAILNSVLDVALVATVVFLAWLLMKGQRLTHQYMKRVLKAVYEKVTEEHAQELREKKSAVRVYEKDGEIIITEERVIHTCTQSSTPQVMVMGVVSADDDDDEDDNVEPTDTEAPQEQEAAPAPSEEEQEQPQPQKPE